MCIPSSVSTVPPHSLPPSPSRTSLPVFWALGILTTDSWRFQIRREGGAAGGWPQHEHDCFLRVWTQVRFGVRVKVRVKVRVRVAFSDPKSRKTVVHPFLAFHFQKKKKTFFSFIARTRFRINDFFLFSRLLMWLVSPFGIAEKWRLCCFPLGAEAGEPRPLLWSAAPPSVFPCRQGGHFLPGPESLYPSPRKDRR